MKRKEHRVYLYMSESRDKKGKEKIHRKGGGKGRRKNKVKAKYIRERVSRNKKEDDLKYRQGRKKGKEAVS